MSAKWPLTESDRMVFDNQGYLYIQNFYNPEDVLAVQKGIYSLFSLIIETHKLPIERPSFSPENFDFGCVEMQKSHRKLLGQLYEAIKKLPAYFKLACSSRHEEISEFLLRSDMVGIANRGWGVRMDNPREDKFLTQLHQDYTSQICSPSGLVLWSPLRKVTAEMGPVKIYPGSHFEGILDIEVSGNDSYGLQLRNPRQILDKYKPISPEVAVTDLVVTHILTAHESTPNRSQETRWAMISRYFDFTESIGRTHAWQGGLQEGGVFAKIHPEKCNVGVQEGPMQPSMKGTL